MTDDEKNAAIEAEYMPLIRELAAKKDPLANLAAILFAGDMYSAQGGRAEAVEIEKITTVTPEPHNTVSEICKSLNISRATLYRYVKTK